jgi:hypothetical protein
LQKPDHYVPDNLIVFRYENFKITLFQDTSDCIPYFNELSYNSLCSD